MDNEVVFLWYGVNCKTVFDCDLSKNDFYCDFKVKQIQRCHFKSVRVPHKREKVNGPDVAMVNHS